MKKKDATVRHLITFIVVFTLVVSTLVASISIYMLWTNFKTTPQCVEYKVIQHCMGSKKIET